MRKLMLIAMLMLGLTFIYNPQNNTGFVYINNDPSNWIVIIDPSTNSLIYYRAMPTGTERLDQGIEAWIRDKVDKGMPFKSMIIPFKPQQQRAY